MGRLVVRIITNTKKPTSALTGIKRISRYFVFSKACSNDLIFVVVHKY